MCLHTLYSALKDGSSEAPKVNPRNTQVKEILDTVDTGVEPSTRSQAVNCLTVEGERSWENLETSDGTADNLWLIIRDWVLSCKLAIDLKKNNSRNIEQLSN